MSVIAYYLGNLWLTWALPKKIQNWSMTILQQRLVKTGGRLVKRALYHSLLLAEWHLDGSGRWAGSRCYDGELVVRQRNPTTAGRVTRGVRFSARVLAWTRGG